MFQFKLATNSKRIQLDCDDETLFEELRVKFRVVNPNLKYQTMGSKFLSPITPIGTIPMGLFFDVYKMVKQLRPTEQITVDPLLMKQAVPFSFKDVEIINPENDKFVFRDYQLLSVQYGMKYGRGIFNLATSAGKSLVIYSLIKNMFHYVDGVKTVLVYVPSIQLVYQMQKDFIEYGCNPDDVSIYSSGQKVPKFSKIIISNRQWLQLHGDNLPKIDAVFVDEAHSLKSDNKCFKFIESLPTNIRFGFTGTMPAEKDQQWKLIGLIGQKLITKNAQSLQNNNQIANVKIVNLHFRHHGRPDSPKPPPDTLQDEVARKIFMAKQRFPLEWKFIEQSTEFIDTIAKIAVKSNSNTIILTDHIIHNQKIYDHIASNCNDKHVWFIHGETPVQERETIRQQMEDYDNCILVASTACFKQGINIKNIHNIIFAFAHGKSNVKIIQSIGRSLRLLDSKTEAIIFDVSHALEYSEEHYEERKKFYVTEYGISDKDIKRYNFKCTK
jgi:superfamily II DNA or RNA helicase